MDVVAVVAKCSQYEDRELVRALVRVHSRGLPYFVVDRDAVLMPTYAPSLEVGREALRRRVTAGLHPVVGLLSVPTEWAQPVGKRVEDLFQPCTNIAIGTAALVRFDTECRRQLGPERADSVRMCVVGKYAEAIGLPDILPEAVARAVWAMRRQDEALRELAAKRRAPAPESGRDSAAGTAGILAEDSSGLIAGSPIIEPPSSP